MRSQLSRPTHPSGTSFPGPREAGSPSKPECCVPGMAGSLAQYRCRSPRERSRAWVRAGKGRGDYASSRGWAGESCSQRSHPYPEASLGSHHHDRGRISRNDSGFPNRPPTEMGVFTG